MRYEQVKFGDSYYLAWDIWQIIVENPAEDILAEHFDPNDVEIRQQFAAPHRWTLLHDFIKEVFWDLYVESFERDKNDMLDLVVQEYRTILDGWNIAYPEVSIPNELEDDESYDAKLEEIVASLRSRLPIERIVHVTFQLLFEDREFLLRFSTIVSQAVRSMKQDEYPEILSRDGMLRRRELPIWAKQGVFFRDRGRCIKCGRDLTGTVVTGEELHYDHIVPLAQGGTNDPTNFQLLCRDCNLRKGPQEGQTSDRYPVYWSLD